MREDSSKGGGWGESCQRHSERSRLHPGCSGQAALVRATPSLSLGFLSVQGEGVAAPFHASQEGGLWALHWADWPLIPFHLLSRRLWSRGHTSATTPKALHRVRPTGHRPTLGFRGYLDVGQGHGSTPPLTSSVTLGKILIFLESHFPSF